MSKITDPHTSELQSKGLMLKQRYKISYLTIRINQYKPYYDSDFVKEQVDSNPILSYWIQARRPNLLAHRIELYYSVTLCLNLSQ